MGEGKFMSLKTCAEELGVSDQYVRSLFRRTKFWPVLRIHQIAFYMRNDFEDWCLQYWKAGQYIYRLGGRPRSIQLCTGYLVAPA